MVEKIVLKINLNYKSLSHPTVILSSGVEGDGGIFWISTHSQLVMPKFFYIFY